MDEFVGGKAMPRKNEEKGYTEVDPDSKQMVRVAALTIYIAGLAIWIFVYHFGVGWRSLSRTPYLWIAFLMPFVLMGLNLGFSQQETVNSYPQERQESSIVQQIAFYSMASLFAFTNIISRMSSHMLSIVAPILALAFFFAIVLVMPPFWVSTSDPREIIVIKHIKTVFLTFAHGLIAAVMMYVLFYEAIKPDDSDDNTYAIQPRRPLRVRRHRGKTTKVTKSPQTSASPPKPLKREPPTPKPLKQRREETKATASSITIPRES